MSGTDAEAGADILAMADAVLLDMDGTLVLSEAVHRQCWQLFFDCWGVDVADTEYEELFMGRRPSDVIVQVAGPWSGSDVTSAVGLMTEHAVQLVSTVPVVPGAGELLRRLHGLGIPIAVVTSAGAAWAERILTAVLGVRHLVDVVITAEEVTDGKPSPEGYLKACSGLRVPPERCVAFEDSPSGVRALMAAGVRDIVGVTTTTAGADLMRFGARWTLPDLLPDRVLPALGHKQHQDIKEQEVEAP
ncbi:HAD family phosphatase [Streptomyces sp. NBC_00210]|uniref:HAD family hydrolase n=1 Tax=unclassified Streptomyces TaxID=2593676 RepID=UPI0032537AF2